MPRHATIDSFTVCSSRKGLADDARRMLAEALMPVAKGPTLVLNGKISKDVDAWSQEASSAAGQFAQHSEFV